MVVRGLRQVPIAGAPAADVREGEDSQIVRYVLEKLLISLIPHEQEKLAIRISALTKEGRAC
jgi:hypothetical protein